MTDWKQQVRVQLETVTPLFLGGADPQGEPELRPPAFRGAMRYWFRAALGGVIGDGNLDGLRKLEREVFGDTKEASPLKVRIHGSLKSKFEEILPHKEEEKTRGKRKAFFEGQNFELVLFQTIPGKECVWNAACAAFSLSMLLGGVGLRSRRGFGTLRIVDSSDGCIEKMPIEFDEWKVYIQKTVENAVTRMHELAEYYKVPTASLLSKPTSYPCANKGGIIQVCDLKVKNYKEAIIHLMRSIPNHVALGGIKPRQSSPLWVRVIQIGKGYGLLFTVLASDFRGNDYEMVKRFLEKFHDSEEKNYCESYFIKGWNL